MEQCFLKSEVKCWRKSLEISKINLGIKRETDMSALFRTTETVKNVDMKLRICTYNLHLHTWSVHDGDCWFNHTKSKKIKCCCCDELFTVQSYFLFHKKNNHIQFVAICKKKQNKLGRSCAKLRLS